LIYFIQPAILIALLASIILLAKFALSIQAEIRVIYASAIMVIIIVDL
jgi:hypothetical protein